MLPAKLVWGRKLHRRTAFGSLLINLKRVVNNSAHAHLDSVVVPEGVVDPVGSIVESANSSQYIL